MRPLLRIFRFCNPQRKHLYLAFTFILVGVPGINGFRVIYSPVYYLFRFSVLYHWFLPVGNILASLPTFISLSNYYS